MGLGQRFTQASASSAWHRNDEPGFAETDIVLQIFRRLRCRARMAASRSGIAMAHDRDWARKLLSGKSLRVCWRMTAPTDELAAKPQPIPLVSFLSGIHRQLC